MAQGKRGKNAAGKGSNEGTVPGVWNRGSGRGPANPIRVRTKRLDEIDVDKIALAYWLLAKRIVENESEVPVTEEDARRVAAELEGSAGTDEKRSARKRGGRS